MREKIAIMLCVLSIAVSFALSVTFAILHNHSSPTNLTPTVAGPSGNAPVSQNAPLGQTLFETQSCGTCHSFAGAGNPRLPLDGIGQKLSDQEMRDWITGSGASTNKLPSLVLKRKQKYQSLTEDQFKALVSYLRTGS